VSDLADAIAKKLTVPLDRAERAIMKARADLDEDKRCVLADCDQSPIAIMFLAGYIQNGSGGAFVAWPVCETHEESHEELASGLFETWPTVVSIGVKLVSAEEIRAAS
jgi:hypothetical protein